VRQISLGGVISIYPAFAAPKVGQSVTFLESLSRRRISWPERIVSIPIKITPAGLDSKNENDFYEGLNSKWVLVATILGSSIQGTRVVRLDRRRRLERNEQGVIQKFGVKPSSIPDYLALVGDAADGYPGLQGWGAKSASGVLSRFGRLEAIPSDTRDWQVNISNMKNLSEVLNRQRKLAFLFRDIATLRTDLPLFATVDELLWKGPTPAFPSMAVRLDKATFSKKPVPHSRVNGNTSPRDKPV
jgi:5'-3' exonuclease, C-terminal SAM fold